MDLDNQLENWLPYYYFWINKGSVEKNKRMYLLPYGKTIYKCGKYNEPCVTNNIKCSEVMNYFSLANAVFYIMKPKEVAELRLNGALIQKYTWSEVIYLIDNSYTLYNYIHPDLQNKYEQMCLKKIFKDYKIVNLIGRGTQGTVYGAKYGDKKFAIKIEECYNCNLRGEREQQLLKINKLASDLKIGPKIITYGFCEETEIESYIYIIMDILPGETITKIWNKYMVKLRQGEKTINDIKNFDILFNLIRERYRILFNNNIVHNDPKGDNIIVETSTIIEKSRVWIIDYGISSVAKVNIETQLISYIKFLKLSLTTKITEFSTEPNEFAELSDNLRSDILKYFF